MVCTRRLGPPFKNWTEAAVRICDAPHQQRTPLGTTSFKPQHCPVISTRVRLVPEKYAERGERPEALTSNAVGGSGLVRKWTSLATRFCSSAKPSGS